MHNNKEFVPEDMEKVNVAGKAICEWVWVVVEFWEIYENTEHKRLSLKQAKEENAKTLAKIKETKEELETLTKRLAVLDEENMLARVKKQ